jgi:hypothetical protein
MGDLERVLSQAIAHEEPALIYAIAQPWQHAAAPVDEWVA